MEPGVEGFIGWPSCEGHRAVGAGVRGKAIQTFAGLTTEKAAPSDVQALSEACGPPGDPAGVSPLLHCPFPLPCTPPTPLPLELRPGVLAARNPLTGQSEVS